MRQYKIYNRIYKTDHSDSKEVTFGCQKYFIQNILVGTSSVNSHDFATVEMSCIENEDHFAYSLLVDGGIIKTIKMNKKIKEFYS